METMGVLEIALSILIGVVSVTIAVFTIKFAVTFDVNQWQERRDKRRKDAIKVLCPHAIIELSEEGHPQITSTLTSPFGTLMWICSRCGLTTHDDELAHRLVNGYMENPKALLEKEKKFRKRAKKYLGI